MNYIDSKCGFFSAGGNEFALLSSLIGIVLTKDLTIDEQNSLGNFLVGIGQTMMTAAAQNQVIIDEQR